MRAARSCSPSSTASAWASPASGCTCCCSTATPPAASCSRHPLECADVGWFAPRRRCRRRRPGAQWWAPMAFAAIDGEPLPTAFDPVRSPDLATLTRPQVRRAAVCGCRPGAQVSAGRGRGGTARPRRRARRDRRSARTPVLVRRRRRRRSSSSSSAISSTIASSRPTYVDEVLVVGDQRRHPGVVLGDAGRRDASTGAGVPIIAHARSTSAIAAFGDGTCAA